MNFKLLTLASLIAASTTLAAPFLSTLGDRKTLERTFLATGFCQRFKCQKRPPDSIYNHLVFKLHNGLEVHLDAWHASGVYLKLEPKKSLSLEQIRTMRALIRVATGQDIGFDVLKNCSSITAIRQSKAQNFYLQPSKRLGVISCLEDTTGIPKGQENTAPEFVPRYDFAIVLPV